MLKIAVDSRKNSLIQHLMEKEDTNADEVDSTVFTSDEMFDVRRPFFY